MRRLTGIALFVVLVAFTLSAAEQAHGTIVLVRHAAKQDDSSDPPLSEAGIARAKALAALLDGAGVTAIYTTQYKRTIDTAAPLAKVAGLTPVVVSGKETAALVERLRASAPGDLIVVVGHSNTIPEILAALGCPDEVAIANDQYDDLFIVLPHDGKPGLLRLKY